MILLKDALFIRLEASVKEAIAAVDGGGQGIALVVDDDRRLIGVLTDHDLRKALLSGAHLHDPAAPYVNRAPVVAGADQAREAIFELIHRTNCSPIPLLDATGCVVGLESLPSILRPARLSEHLAVIMAGGPGMRLRPLTADRPKPMLPVSGKPILQIILERLKTCGFRKVYIAVHYQREMIEEYFGDGQQLGIHIGYLRESSPLGTAGALALLPERPTSPFLVMNGDLLSHVTIESLFDHHVRSQERITLCLRMYEMQIPYGVVRLEGRKVIGLEEKPVHECFVNAGIYVLDPEVLDLIEGPQRLDMTDLIARAIDRWGRINSFPIHEYWLDIGQHDEYERARQDYHLAR